MSINIKTLLKIVLIVFLFIIIASYSYYQFRDLVNGPQIEIIYPQNGETLSDSLLKISGETKNISYISLNDRPIFVDEKGYFEEDLLLLYGYNVIKIEAKDRFGKKTEKILEVVYK